MTLAELRKALADKTKGLSDLQTKAFADGATQEDTDALQKALDEIDGINAKIALAERAENAVKAAAQPVDETETSTVPAAVERKLKPVEKLGLALTSIIKAHQNRSTPHEELEKNGYGTFVKELVSTTPADGGYAVPTPLASEIIEILREDSAFLAGNPRRIRLPNGNFTIPAGDSGVVGGYGAEASDIGVEQQTFRDVNLQAKRLSVLVPASNELLSWSVGDMQSFIEDDIRGALGENMDLALLRGDGQSNRPLGITRIAGVPSFAGWGVGGTPIETIQRVEATLAKAETEMRNRKIHGRRAAWIMHPRTRIWLSGLRDGNGNRVYPEVNYGPGEGSGPRLRSKPVYETTMMPANLGTGGDETDIHLIDFSHVLFGEATGLSFRVSEEASYKVGGVIMHHDADVRHPGAVVNITGLDWYDNPPA
jgi:HK97 family phage major capsid protein